MSPNTLLGQQVTSMEWMKTEIWPSVQPVLRETGHAEYPYAISGGTIFLAAYQGRGLAITARHALLPLTSICLFSSDSSQRILPLENVFYVTPEKIDDDFADFAIIEMDMRKLVGDSDFASLKLIDLEKVSGDWLDSSSEAVFLVLGYPLEHSELQFTERSITTPRFVLRGSYKGVSEYSSSVHIIELSKIYGITDFNGFSGGPVFAFLPNDANPQKVFLCGMAIRGSSSSGLIHFLELGVILAGIQVKPAPYNVVRKRA